GGPLPPVIDRDGQLVRGVLHATRRVGVDAEHTTGQRLGELLRLQRQLERAVGRVHDPLPGHTTHEVRRDRRERRIAHHPPLIQRLTRRRRHLGRRLPRRQERPEQHVHTLRRRRRHRNTTTTLVGL